MTEITITTGTESGFDVMTMEHPAYGVIAYAYRRTGKDDLWTVDHRSALYGGRFSSESMGTYDAEPGETYEAIFLRRADRYVHGAEVHANGGKDPRKRSRRA